MHRSRRIKVEWPAWRFGPDGESQMFDDPKDVPEGWTPKPPSVIYEAPEQAPVDKEKIIDQLKEFGVTPDPRWGAVKLQEVLKELIND